MNALLHALANLARLCWLGAAFCALAIMCATTSANAITLGTQQAQTKTRVGGFEQNSPLNVCANAFASGEQHLAISSAQCETASAFSHAAEGGGVAPLVYGPSAGGDLASTAARLGGQTLTDLVKPTEMGWEAFSKQTLDAAAASGRQVIFDLTNMQNIQGVLSGAGQFASTVTGAELRYIQANWTLFQGNVTFISSGAIVSAPW